MEFDIESTQDDLKFLRELNQSMVESHIQFKLNGRVHTRNILEKDLDFSLNGKKVVKSIQNRLKHYANYILKHKKGYKDNGDYSSQYVDFVKSNKKQFYVKFINISQSFGIKIEVNQSNPQQQNFRKPINVFTANFNKIVKAGIKIKSFIFTFNIPNQDLRVNLARLNPKIVSISCLKPI